MWGGGSPRAGGDAAKWFGWGSTRTLQAGTSGPGDALLEQPSQETPTETHWGPQLSRHTRGGFIAPPGRGPPASATARHAPGTPQTQPPRFPDKPTGAAGSRSAPKVSLRTASTPARGGGGGEGRGGGFYSEKSARICPPKPRTSCPEAAAPLHCPLLGVPDGAGSSAGGSPESPDAVQVTRSWVK